MWVSIMSLRQSKHNLIVGPYLSNGEDISMLVTIKTRPAHWQNSTSPVLVPFSIHSHIYDGIQGTFKIAALLNLIKNCVKGEATILFCEKAHLNVLSLKYSGDLNKALEVCEQDTHGLMLRFKDELDGFHIAHWANFVNDDPGYIHFRNKLLDLYDTDSVYRSLVTADIAETYTIERQNEYPDKEQYFDACKLDLIEMTVFSLIASKKGYHFYFYPGKSWSSMTYINNQFLTENERLSLVNVRISLKDQCENATC